MVLMGLFAVYVGLIYNDIFSMAVYAAPSGWDVRTVGNQTITSFRNTYPFGIDPVRIHACLWLFIVQMWHGAENALLFSNSYKMKMAIILGVIHVRRAAAAAFFIPRRCSLVFR